MHLNKFAASQFKGEEGSGLVNKREIANRVDFRVQAGDQAVFNMSKQISPVFLRLLIKQKPQNTMYLLP